MNLIILVIVCIVSGISSQIVSPGELRTEDSNPPMRLGNVSDLTQRSSKIMLGLNLDSVTIGPYSESTEETTSGKSLTTIESTTSSEGTTELVPHSDNFILMTAEEASTKDQPFTTLKPFNNIDVNKELYTEVSVIETTDKTATQDFNVLEPTKSHVVTTEFNPYQDEMLSPHSQTTAISQSTLLKSTMISETTEEMNSDEEVSENTEEAFTETQVYTTSESVIAPPKELTIVVIGRSGSGISSTVHRILGTSKIPSPNTPENRNPLLTEYLVQLSENSTSILRLLDVEGLVNGKTIEEDALILSTLKDYFQNPNISSSPTIFIIVSNFDDNRFFGPHTQYTNTLSRISLLQNSVFISQGKNAPSNIYLLTRHQAETKLVQRRSKSKVEQFAQTIQSFTKFVPPYKILLGENYPDSDLTVDEYGFVKLLNKDLYPKNIFDAIAQKLQESKMPEFANEILLFAMKRNNLTVQPNIISYPNSTTIDSIDEFQGLINLLTYDIEDTEVNTVLQKAFDEIEASQVKNQIRNSIVMLQAHLQYLSIRNISQLPKTTIEKVKFFQLLPSSLRKNAFVFLKESFDGYMPEYIQPIVVGSSYDILTDQVLALSPLEIESMDTSSSGYLLPSHITCQNIQNPTIINQVSIVANSEEYKKARISKLYFEEKYNLNISRLRGPKRHGYNYYDNGADSLQTEKEIRTFKFILNEQVKFNAEFLEMIKGLTPINLNDRDSVRAWEKFFNTYGTHIVTSGFVGGRIQGTLSIEDLFGIQKNETNEILENMVSMRDIPLHFNITSKPKYTFFGGELYENLTRWNSLSTEQQNILLQDWITSLKYEPSPLTHELHLESLNQIVAKNFNSSIGTTIKVAKDLYLTGKMIYVRAMGNKRNRTNNPKGKTTSSTTTATQSTRIETTTKLPKSDATYPGVDTTNRDITKPIELEHIQPVPGSHYDLGKLGTKTMNQEEERIWKDYNERVERLERFKHEEITRIQTQNLEHFKQKEQQRAKLQHEHEKILKETEEFERAQLIKNLPTLPLPPRGVGKRIENYFKECLRAGTKILMEDWNEVEVENLKAGDYVLNYNLKPTRVVGVLKKLLGDNNGFFGLNENGPYFFTKTHIMVGPKNKLYVKDLEALLEENPIMKFLEVEEFNRSGNELYEYSPVSKTMRAKTVQIYSDPEPSSPNTWVYIILVDSKDGTYIANNYNTRHELPPLEIWPNTVQCILGPFNERNQEMRDLLDLEYTPQNVGLLANKITDLNRLLEQEFRKAGTNEYEYIDENSQKYEPQDNILEELYANPILFHLVSELYRVSGELIANELDNPSKPLSSFKSQFMISNIQKIIIQHLTKQ